MVLNVSVCFSYFSPFFWFKAVVYMTTTYLALQMFTQHQLTDTGGGPAL